MKGNPLMFLRSLDRHYGEETASREYSGSAPFPTLQAPTATLFLTLGMTKKTGKADSRKASVGLALPFSQAGDPGQDVSVYDVAYDKLYSWVTRQLISIHKGDWSIVESPPVMDVEAATIVPSPAAVPVPFSYGMTIDLGDYQFVTSELSLTVLADPDRVRDAFDFVVPWVRGKVEEMERKTRALMARK